MQPGTPPEQVPALRERVAAARLTQRQAMGATGEASSGDGRVRAVVDATGVVTSLTFTPSVFDDTTPAKLAITVVATIQAAAAKARAQVTEAMAPIRADSEQARAGGGGHTGAAGAEFRGAGRADDRDRSHRPAGGVGGTGASGAAASRRERREPGQRLHRHAVVIDPYLTATVPCTGRFRDESPTNTV